MAEKFNWTREVGPETSYCWGPDYLWTTSRCFGGGKEAALVFHVKDRNELQEQMETDPYWTEGLVEEYQVNEWNPMFGMLGASPEQIEEYFKHPENFK